MFFTLLTLFLIYSQNSSYNYIIKDFNFFFHFTPFNTHYRQFIAKSSDSNSNTTNLSENEKIKQLLLSVKEWEDSNKSSKNDSLSSNSNISVNDLVKLEKKFLESIESDENSTFNRIISEKIKETIKEKEEKKEKTVDWRDLVQEFRLIGAGKKCYGCGVNLQFANINKRGYVQECYYHNDLAKCERCSSLSSDIKSSLIKNTSGVDGNNLNLVSENLIREASSETINIVRNMLRIKKRRRITILYIIDVVDPHIEFKLLEIIKQREEIGGIRFYLILNKIDLLPKYNRDELVQFFKKMINSKVDLLKSKHIFTISSKFKKHVSELMSVILEEAKRLGNQILFIGPTNSGKSTLINLLRSSLKSKSRSLKNAKSTNNVIMNGSNSLMGKRLTSSIIPGTTLGVINISLGDNLSIYDTPGIFVPNSLISHVNGINLKDIITQNICPNTPIRLKKGSLTVSLFSSHIDIVTIGYSMLIDKYVRIDMTSGRDVFFKCYFSDKLKLHIKPTHKINQFLNKHYSDQFLHYPTTQHTSITSDDTVNGVDNVNSNNSTNDNWVMRRMNIILNGWDNATCDLCIKGLGFLTIGGALSADFNLYTMKNILYYLRPPLFPKNIFPFVPRKS
ncbi:uncharacterized protein TA14095 [Theileria annulata]|uniref:Uncharacterized protein n=1 Tax=Theileria annulata TaxID=5874 RepID=Q4UEV8_THEAN|nr:uncharacterized protein TA14095 [Theileria annulata]CAI74381.1 hypothetical protein, conserved [Theileria annulata]|eukprot:XP_952113.1 hypothetical protein, conserved [Theileria annulata]